MGYQVYRDVEGNDRWAGYGVPAECDWADCAKRIDRGLGCKCEDHGGYELILDGESIDYLRIDDEPAAEEEWVETAGCGLYFCESHRVLTDRHDGVAPKPDSAEWNAHILSDDSWQQWRDENPDVVEGLISN